MRNLNTVIISILTITVILLPLFAIKSESKSSVYQSSTRQTAAGFVKGNESTASFVTENTSSTKVRLYNQSTKKVETLLLSDYVFGVVAGEVPMSYEDEAIKAQIVAAKTYTLYRIGISKKEKYDISSDSETSQHYITKKEAYKNWGSGAKEYEKKLNVLIKETENCIITYKGKPILAVYHAISSGRTESGKNVWQSDLPYLQPVESVGDKLANNYLSEADIKEKDANKSLKSQGFSAKTLAGGKITKTESGNIIKITSGKKSIAGPEVCRLFSLRSQNFDITYKKGILHFTVRGYGHQAGMSQNGANYMAKCGSNFKEILTHYYTGVTVTG